MVEFPKDSGTAKGEPPTLDLYRSPSSRMAVLLTGLLMRGILLELCQFDIKKVNLPGIVPILGCNFGILVDPLPS